MQSFIDRLSLNFILPAFIPALAFTFGSMVLFGPIVPKSITDRFPLSFEHLTQGAILLLLLSFLLGFTLSSLNLFIYKVTEGYFLLERIPWWYKREQKKAAYYKKKIMHLEQVIKKLQKKNFKGPYIKHLKDKLHTLKSDYQLNYPPRISLVLPTRFGNIHRASEYYSNQRYRIDSVSLWPRLVHVIHPTYFGHIQEGNNELAFLVNCLWLSLLLALLCLSASIYQWILWRFAVSQTTPPLYLITIDQASDIYYQRGWLYLCSVGVLVGIGYFFYLAALPVARHYGNLVGSAFDLFRFDLLKQLKIKLPETYDDECNQWVQVSTFINGSSEEGPHFFDEKYQVNAGMSDGET